MEHSDTVVPPGDRSQKTKVALAPIGEVEGVIDDGDMEEPLRRITLTNGISGGVKRTVKYSPYGADNPFASLK